ncbi:glycoside hydrolase family 97 protein [Labilibacter sediminis]|nr:glycoside hydrolase family 97 protein [Labilibacter sediminis]
MKQLSLLIMIYFGFVSCSQKHEFSLSSADHKNKITVSLVNGEVSYNVKRNSETIITSSKLGLDFKELTLRQFNSITQKKTFTTQEKWETSWGEKKIITDHHNSMVIELKNDQHKLELHLKSFNDGIAFRYIVPEQNLDSLHLLNELTQFNTPADADYWWIHADYDSYELLYQQSQLAKVDTAHTPLTAKLKSGKHFSIHEAALVDYAAMTLKNNGNGFDCDLVPWPDGIKVKTLKTMTSPWRVILLADDATGLVDSDMILNLNEPNKLGDVSWVKPMKYMGIWWDMHLDTKTWHQGENHGATTEYAMEMIDFASTHGFKGLLVEGWNIGWETWSNWDFTKAYPDFDIEKVQQYANDRDMTIIGHHETGGKVAYEYEPQMKDAFELYGKLGIEAVKTGYVGKIDNKQFHHGQWMVNHYQRVIELAAQNKVSVVAHEPIKDTGLRRTYPNFLAREGVRGQEYNAWGNPPNPPNHTTIIPFTRGLSGPTDFTPGVFRLTYEEYRGDDYPSRVSTTLAKQLGLYVTIYSPVQMACDLPKHYKEHLSMFEFIKSVPVDWEYSKTINAEIGKYFTIARKDRDSDNWYLGSISNEKPRTFEIKLDFLDTDKEYKAIIYADGKSAHWKDNPYEYTITQTTVLYNDSLSINLAAGGGCAIEFKPVIN